MTARYLIDTSAVVRLLRDVDDVHGWQRSIAAGLVALSDLTELEIGFSARSPQHRKSMLELLHSSFALCTAVDGALARAREVQGLLTDRGEHRGPGPVDLQLAATAELSGLTLLHCDNDFETVARATGQPTAILTTADGP